MNRKIQDAFYFCVNFSYFLYMLDFPSHFYFGLRSRWISLTLARHILPYHFLLVDEMCCLHDEFHQFVCVRTPFIQVLQGVLIIHKSDFKKQEK